MADPQLARIETLLQTQEFSRNERHTQVCERLSAIETKQDAFKEYQVECDAERKDLSGRVISLEGFKRNILVLATSITSIGAFGISAFLDWMKK